MGLMKDFQDGLKTGIMMAERKRLKREIKEKEKRIEEIEKWLIWK